MAVSAEKIKQALARIHLHENSVNRLTAYNDAVLFSDMNESELRILRNALNIKDYEVTPHQAGCVKRWSINNSCSCIERHP